MAAFLSRVGLFAFRRRWFVVLLWLAVLGAAGFASAAASGLSDDTMPGTEAQSALDLLKERFGADAGNLDRATAQVVFVAPAGRTITDPNDRAIIDTLVGDVQRGSHVATAVSPFRVLLADDQALLRTTFRMLIDANPDMAVVAEAAGGAEAITLTRTHRPSVVLMDIRMPGTDGLAATTAICADPTLASARVLILTTFETDEYVAKALRAGASGFLGKDVSADALLDGIRTIAAGEALLSPTATRALITRFLSTPDPETNPASPPESARSCSWPPRACPTPTSPTTWSSAR
jgi:DNA-binding NarL/FixJ family response regulator